MKAIHRKKMVLGPNPTPGWLDAPSTVSCLLLLSAVPSCGTRAPSPVGLVLPTSLPFPTSELALSAVPIDRIDPIDGKHRKGREVGTSQAPRPLSHHFRDY